MVVYITQHIILFIIKIIYVYNFSINVNYINKYFIFFIDIDVANDQQIQVIDK